LRVNKVALISFHTCPLATLGEGKAGGMNVYVRELSRHLGSMGIDVDVFTRCHSAPKGRDSHDNEIIDLDNHVRLVHLKGGPPDIELDTLYSYLPAFQEELRRFSEDQGIHYQMVHSHYWLSGYIGRQAAEHWGVPHVVTFHTLSEIKMQARAGEKGSPIRPEVEKELMASAQMIIASSFHEKEAMIRLYGAPASHIEVVPCGVDLSLFKPLDMGEARKKLGLNGEKVIIYVGRIEAIKGIELLLKSAAIMELRDPLKVLVVGGDTTGETTEVRSLKELAGELGIESSLEFVGIVDHTLLPLYYNAADVCVVPSHYESFGLVALEALACGTPVVASRVGGLPAVVQHGRTGYLLSWRCPEPFADSLEVILSSKGLQKSMSIAARKRAEGMGWGAVAEETCRLYDSL
jgi:D-inositol-3-phosphate glycosyltransferase